MIIRIIASITLTILAYMHAQRWGSFFAALHWTNGGEEVSLGYRNPVSRFVFFHLVQFASLVAIWFLWPLGQWGLFAIFVSVWAFIVGIRRELLRCFVRQLLLNLDDGLSLTEAWRDADRTIRNISGVNLNINRYAADPAKLIRHVVSITWSSEEAAEIENRWVKWANAQSRPPAVVEDRVRGG